MIAMLVAIFIAGAVTAPISEADGTLSPGCRAHLERVSASVGREVSAAEDRRYWAARGQKAKYCSDEDERRDSQQREYKREYTQQQDNKRDNGKSRFCRKRWYC